MNSKVKDFLEISKYKNMPETDQIKQKTQPPLEIEFVGERIDLPEIDSVNLSNISLTDAIKNRESVRKYKDEPISLGALSYALWGTQGIKKRYENATLRTVPSAGARHAYETYLLINNVEGLIPGLYRYLAFEHKLVKLESSPTIADDITTGCLNQRMVKNAAVTFIWVADSYRMTYRYGERGYRYLFLDAGHISQNLYLIAQQLNCGTCAIAAFDDDMVNSLLGLDGENQFVVYIAPLGKL